MAEHVRRFLFVSFPGTSAPRIPQEWTQGAWRGGTESRKPSTGLQRAVDEPRLGSNRPTQSKESFSCSDTFDHVSRGRQGSACCLSRPEPCWHKPRAGFRQGRPKLAEPIAKGQRIAFASHSFHVFVPDILKEMVEAAGIKDHVRVAQSSIGGSKVLDHWNVPDAQNKVKEALRTGKVDVLSVSPIHLPDDGIEKFTELALKHNPNIRVLVQEFWLRWDIYEPTTKIPAKTDHNAITGAELRKRHRLISRAWTIISGR